MKNKFLILFLMFVFILNINVYYADSYRGKIVGTGVYLRKGPGTNYESIKTLRNEDEYVMVSSNLIPSENGCPNGWYQIYYEDSKTGYVCSDYVRVTVISDTNTATDNCEAELQNLGFPSSYWSGLCSLKSIHSTWQFVPLQTGLDWSTVVNEESACGVSYIESSDPSNIDYSCKNAYTHTWYPASSTAVAYYMDPRNWFSEKYIFQFEHNMYNNDLANIYTDAVNNIITGAEFYNYHVGIGNNLGQNIHNAGVNAGLSPIFYASRIRQELGSKNSLYNLYSGVYPGFEGYYNFINYGVYDSCATTKGATVCGLEYAQSAGWYGLDNSLTGGAVKIKENYTDVGQYSGYLQKYNIVPSDHKKLYTHQYMTNIAAPSQEAKTTYNTYNKWGILNKSFIFYIPVFVNMNSIDYNANSGAIDSGGNTSPSELDIATIVTSSGYKYSNLYITGIKPNTLVSTVKNNIEGISGSNTVNIKNASDVLVTEGNIGTGFKVTISNATSSETLTVVISGDTSGDGAINALDLLQVQKNILGTYTLSGEYNLAGDTSHDNVINALDLLQVQKSILGTYEIVQ